MTYTSRTTALRGALLAAAVLLAAGQAPARAETRHGLQGDWLYLTVTHGDSRSSDTRGTLLLCDPPQGHAHATEACAELAAVGGDIDAIPARSVFCPMIYAPVTAYARGEWKGRQVDYTRTFSNRCVMAARTGDVFALDG
ncbi:SSI family serine proteinase inhibitor [Streptomyces sp. W16]|uniref:SSI family serine proteinase inhibitor n=1 Tax=Streptomyces sp. W16 TaxID=3076631 RepID=UPI00295AEA06|nr:SSI family serine proteinase inhibitor [Streptomyces sp. W16]MDV9178903.1 SSI family serine proteinase inhibitor [Streptomyces sp. W16]